MWWFVHTILNSLYFLCFKQYFHVIFKRFYVLILLDLEKLFPLMVSVGAGACTTLGGAFMLDIRYRHEEDFAATGVQFGWLVAYLLLAVNSSD